jgi:hypothetical protein
LSLDNLLRLTGTDFDVLKGDEDRDLNDGFRKVECHEFGLGRSFLKSVDVGRSSDVISRLGSRGGFVGERPFFRKGICILEDDI